MMCVDVIFSFYNPPVFCCILVLTVMVCNGVSKYIWL